MPLSLMYTDDSSFPWRVEGTEGINYYPWSDIDEWTEREIGKCGEIWAGSSNGWKFRNQEDAIQFMLTWA